MCRRPGPGPPRAGLPPPPPAAGSGRRSRHRWCGPPNGPLPPTRSPGWDTGARPGRRGSTGVAGNPACEASDLPLDVQSPLLGLKLGIAQLALVVEAGEDLELLRLADRAAVAAPFQQHHA